MSTYIHEAVIVTARGDDVDEIVAFRESMQIDLQQLLIGPVHRANSFYSFALMPHGSGLGFTVSTDMKAVIASFVGLLDRLENTEWVHVVLFDETAVNRGDDPGPYILASSEYAFNGEYWQRVVGREND